MWSPRHLAPPSATATVGKRERWRGRRRVLRSRSARTAHRRANGGSFRDRCVEGAHGAHQAIAASRNALRGCAPDRDRVYPGTARPLHRPPPAAAIGRAHRRGTRASSASSDLRRSGRAAEGSLAGLISVRSAHRKFVRAESVAQGVPCAAATRRSIHERRSDATRRSQRSGSGGPAGDPSAARVSRW